MNELEEPAEEINLEDAKTGSPAGEPVFLAVGRLGRPHGVLGEVQMLVLTEFPERIRRGSKVFIGKDYELLRIIRTRAHQNKLLVTFHGIANREAAEALRGQMVFVRTEEVPALPEGEYYHHQLIHLQVVDEEGNEIGPVVDILETGANDVLIVHGEAGKEILIPLIDDVVKKIDLLSRTLIIHVMPGLLP